MNKEYPDTWSVGQGMLEGKPIFVRIRSGLNDFIGNPDYPFQIGVAVPLLRPTKDGLTLDEEAKELNLIEERLEKKLTANEGGIFVMAITTNGMREFVFYVKEWKPEFYEKEVKSINSGLHELQFMIQEDFKWDTFKKFKV